MNTGYFDHYSPFRSALIALRQVDVWVPDAAKQPTGGQYPVIYMHDGQNLFDSKTSFLGVDWGIHEAMSRLIKENAVCPAIVVGIWSGTCRAGEYGPAKAICKYASAYELEIFQHKFGTPTSDDYLKFIVDELKPFIDRKYSTLPDQQHTFIMGSSFGGLISLYALCEYPQVFAGAASLSTHWPAARGAMISYLAECLPDPATHRIYFDYGTEAIDALYEPYQIQADEVMRKSDYQEGVNWVTKKFPGEEHSERAWRKRVHVPLEFLLRAAF